MNSIFIQTAEKLQQLACTNKEVLVSFSGGKDSIVILDLAKKYFDKVVCFYMYFIPGLEPQDTMIKYYSDLFGVELIQVQHFEYYRFKKRGIYCFNDYDTIPEIGLTDIYRYVRSEIGIEMIMTGMKKSDSMFRAVMRENIKLENLENPLWDWSNLNVISYIKCFDLPIMENEGGNSTGIDLTSRYLLWLYDNYRSEFEKIKKEFPFIQAIIERRKLYGV